MRTLVLYPWEYRGTPRPATLAPRPGAWAMAVPRLWASNPSFSLPPPRGSFTSVQDRIAAIEAFTGGWNDCCRPFTWTKTADEILPHCRPGKRSSFTRK